MSTKRKSDEDRRESSNSSFMKVILVSFLLLPILGVLLSLLLAPPRLVFSSVAPNQTMRVEFWTRGFFGDTWADLIWQNQWKKENVYTEEGNEVIWKKDAEVVWSKNSQKFFVASIKMAGYVPPFFRDNQYLYLTGESNYSKDSQNSYPAVVLTYDIPKKELRHNLYGGLQPFDRRDLKGIDWMQKLPE